MSNVKTITEKFRPVDLSRLTSLLTEFEEKSLGEKTQIIDELVAAHAVLSVDWREGWRFKRARKVSNGNFEHVQDILWPPHSLASAGRANSPGHPVMYLADRTDTALKEIRVLEEEEVVLAEFSIRGGKRCRFLPIGEMLYIHRTGHGRLLKDGGLPLNGILNACRYEEAQAYLITDHFLTKVLEDDVEPYVLSSYLCNALFKKCPDVSAIAYPSARQIGAMNFAVQTEDFWKSWGVASVSKFYAKHLAAGFYARRNRANVTGIYKSGRLLWDEEILGSRTTTLLHPLWVPSV